ncbi:MAG TPA: AraC family transcriptional regulator [Afipia sp.]
MADIQQYTSTTGFSLEKLARLAAEHAIGIDVDVPIGSQVDGPMFSGRLMAHEVQPGLIATASDVTYLSDQQLHSSSESTLMFGVLLNGERETMEVLGHGIITREFERPALLGFSDKTNFKLNGERNQRLAAAGFILKGAFFDRFGDVVQDDGLAELRTFLSGEFRFELMARSPRLLELARVQLEHPYRGQLANLFLESNTLALVVEVAEQLKKERQMVALLGRKHFDRVMEARNILDANLANPPGTLALAGRVGINLTTLQANFKAVFGVTIFGYVRTQRLMMARILLREHELAVAEAGYRVGFANPAAFTAAYRRYFGRPPSHDAREVKREQ